MLLPPFVHALDEAVYAGAEYMGAAECELAMAGPAQTLGVAWVAAGVGGWIELVRRDENGHMGGGTARVTPAASTIGTRANGA